MLPLPPEAEPFIHGITAILFLLFAGLLYLTQD